MKEILSDFKLQTGYLKYLPELERKETWDEAVDRVMAMHKTKYHAFLDNPEFIEYLNKAESVYKDKLVLASQRLLQFGGDPVLKHNSRVYNCLSSYADRVHFFREAMYWLLSGCGVGFSVQKQHIKKLPVLQQRYNGTKTFVVPDSIEGWSDAIGVLLASYFRADEKFREYWGYNIRFDFSLIRLKGALLSSGFIAPGHEPLKKALENIENLIENWIEKEGFIVRPILAYDIVMFSSDAVLAGGVRRSATICLFSKDDKEMLNAKTGDWYYQNPQRARSNNSVILLRNGTSKEEFAEIMKSVKEWGEPGFVWTDDLDICFNPCVEIGMYPKLKVSSISMIGDKVWGETDGNEYKEEEWISGWQGCNLTEGNGAKCKDRETFLRMCEGLAIHGTLQAGYTDFVYVGAETKAIFEKEALLGCSITGWMDSPEILLNPELQREGAKLILSVNEKLAALIGINPASRATCSKPSGNASVILGCSSGTKGEHAQKYFRQIQVNEDEYGVEWFKEQNEAMFEKNMWTEGKGYVISFPIEIEDKVIFSKDILGVKQLEYVKLIQQNWVEAGTNIERCVIPNIRHNVSNTITVNNWDEVENYIFENRQWFAGISLLSMSGDKDYVQAPFAEVLTDEEIVFKYGVGAMFASGLIVDGLHCFDNNLWIACDHVLNKDLPIEGSRVAVFVKKDWIRRAKQFARRYFKGNLKQMTYCLKDVHYLHRWMTIKKTFKEVDWSKFHDKITYKDINTMGAITCSGDSCTINI